MSEERGPAGKDPTERLPLRPRSIGAAAPRGNDVYEFYVRARSHPSVLGRISGAFGRRNVDILGSHSTVSEDRSIGEILFYAELAHATVKAEDLLEELLHAAAVLEVKMAPKNRRYLEELAFPPTVDGTYRAMIFPTEWWVSLAEMMCERYGTAGSALLHEEGLSAGKSLAGRFRDRVPDSDRALFRENLCLASQAAGLGLVTIEPTEPRDGDASFHLVVREGTWGDRKEHSPKEGQFLVGLLRGAMEKIHGKEYAVTGLMWHDDVLAFDLVVVLPSDSLANQGEPASETPPGKA